MRETSRAISGASGRINHVYGGRVFRSRIASDHHLKNVYKYVYRNPVEAGLVTQVQDYRYSTLLSLFGDAVTIIPLEFDFVLFADDERRVVEWLNSAPEKGHREALKFGLRAQTFRLPKLRRSGRAHPLESLCY